MNPFDPSQPAPVDLPSKSVWLSYSIGELLVATTLAAVVASLWRFAPGVGFLATIVVVPVAIRTLLVLRRRAEWGQVTSRGQRLALFFASLLVCSVMTVSILGLLFVAAFAALGVMCNTGDEQMVFTVGLVVVGLISLVIVFYLFPKWIRHRWTRDAGMDHTRELEVETKNE